MATKKEPGISKRGSRWQIDTFYQGHRLRDSFATLPVAKKNLLKLKTLVDEGRYLEKKREPKEVLGELMERYLEWCKGMREKAYYSKDKRLGLVVERIGRDLPLSKLTRSEIEKYQSERFAAPGLKRKPISKATVNRDVAVLKHMLNKAVSWRILEDNPPRGVKMLKESGRRLRYLSPEEITRLLGACSATMKLIVMLALYTGMRKSEILRLTWDNVNLREEYIELVDQKNGERSIIPLNPVAIAPLRSIPPRIDSRYVFTGKVADKPFYDLKRQFEDAAGSAGPGGVTFHVLTHTSPLTWSLPASISRPSRISCTTSQSM